MAHPDVALDVQRRGAGEAEGFHVRVNLRFVQTAVGPATAETRNQFVVHRATEGDY